MYIIEIIVIDADYTFNRKNQPVIRLFGKQIQNNNQNMNIHQNTDTCMYVHSQNTDTCMYVHSQNTDTCIHVHGFEPYIYLGYKPTEMKWENIFDMKKELEKTLKGYIKKITITRKYLPMEYQKEKSDVLKLIFYNPKTVPDIRKILEEEYDIYTGYIYEADIPFKDRFLIDKRINGMTTVKAKCKKLRNYGLNCKEIYICKHTDIEPINREIEIEY